jgi:hypothetical protein
MSEFWAYSAGPYLAVLLLVGLPLWALYHARTFVRKL